MTEKVKILDVETLYPARASMSARKKETMPRARVKRRDTNEKNYTSIRCHKSTYAAFCECGHFGETADQVLRTLIAHYHARYNGVLPCSK